MPKSYRVLPGPVAITSTGRNPTTRAAEAYRAIIAEQAEDGWDFVCFDSTVVHNKNCCGLSTESIHIKLLVFSRER